MPEEVVVSNFIHDIIDKELAEGIYSKVRSYSMLKEKPEDGSYFEEICEIGLTYQKHQIIKIEPPPAWQGLFYSHPYHFLLVHGFCCY